MKIPTDFKVNREISGTGVRPQCVTKMIEVLEKLPFKELITLREVANRLRMTQHYLCHHGRHPDLESRRCELSTTRIFYGSARTIKELKKQNAETE